MRGAARNSEAGNDDIFFKCKRGRHDLAVDRADGLGSQWTLTPLHEAAEEFGLAVGSVDRQRGAVFDDANFFRERGPLVEKSEQLGVECVDLFPEGVEIAHGSSEGVAVSAGTSEAVS